LPARAGFLKPLEAFNFFLDTQNDENIQLKFAYSDRVPRLSPHEVSFHGGSLILPSKFFVRARQIQEHIKNIIDLLNLEKTPGLKALADRLTIARNVEVDFSTGNFQTMIAKTRVLTQATGTVFLSYRQLRNFLFSESTEPELTSKLEGYIDLLSQPSMKPVDAASQRIQKLIEMPQKKSVWPWKNKPLVSLSKSEMIKLQSIMASYHDAHQNDDPSAEISNSRVWLSEFLAGADERIQDFVTALRAP